MKKSKLSDSQKTLVRQRMKAARYIKVVNWSDEDQCFIGRCPELFAGGIHGDNELKVYRELRQAADEWIANIEADGKALPKPNVPRVYSGKFVLRMSPSMHETLAIKAALEKESLNAYTVKRLSSLAGIEPRLLTVSGR